MATMEYYRFHALCYIAFILGTCQWSFECYGGYIALYCQVIFSWWRLFSKGHILLPHLHNHLSAQLTHTLLCLGSWSQLGFVKNEDIKKVVWSNAEDEESADEDIYWVVIMFYLDTYCPIWNEYLCFDWEPYPPWVKTLEPVGMTWTLSWRVRVFCG